MVLSDEEKDYLQTTGRWPMDAMEEMVDAACKILADNPSKPTGAREWWIDDIMTDSPYKRAWTNAQDGDEKCTRAVHVIEKSAYDAKCAHLSKQLETSLEWKEQAQIYLNERNAALAELEQQCANATRRRKELSGDLEKKFEECDALLAENARLKMELADALDERMDDMPEESE